MKCDKVKIFELNKAVLFLVFNREDTTWQVFERIRDVKPPRLYIAADGPRNEQEAEKCNNVREVALHVDWPCELFTLFREHNLGCRYAISSAIDWFFEHEEEGIILEDDCLPHPDFFLFCQELLDKYRDDEKIMHISGGNFQLGKKRGSGSYYFSNYSHIWGWATWRRAWGKYDVDMKDLKSFKEKKQIKKIFKNIIMQKYWIHILNKVDNKAIDTWDFQWAYTVFSNGGKAIIPNNNMISNIGFGGGTNTLGDSMYANLPLEALDKLTFPHELEVDRRADKYYFKTSLLDCVKHYIIRKVTR